MRVQFTGLLLATLTLPSLACAQTVSESQPATERQISYTDAATILIQAGRFDDAKRVIELALQQAPNNNEAIFLRGMIAIAEKNYEQAIGDFRQILVSEPERERVRLELARAFFLVGDYDNAERNFRFARAGDLPPEVKANTDQYLAAIVRLKIWSYNVGLAIAQDTNVNGATSVHQIDLYGLPFTLSDNARATSGIGMAIDLGGEWSPLVSDNVKAKFGGQVHRLEYGGSTFDDMTLSAYAGPEFLLPKWQIDTLVTTFSRWYGNTPYNQGIGGRAAVTYALLPGLQVGTAVDVQSVSYRMATDENGTVGSGYLETSYTITPSSIVHVVIGAGNQTAHLSAFADTTHWMALDYYQDLPWGFSANIEPAFSWIRYHAPLAAFGVTRSDHIWAARLDILNRRFEYGGFAPRLSLIYTNQSSTIPLYRYSRAQVQLGLTRQF